MKPITEIRKEADRRLETAITREEAVTERENAVTAREEEVIERIEAVRDTESELSGKAEELDRREKKVREAEQAHKDSQNKLADSWTEYHETVHRTNASLSKREREVEDGRKANDAIRIAQEKRSKEQDAQDRQIKDRYATLQRAIEEWRAKPIVTGKH